MASSAKTMKCLLVLSLGFGLTCAAGRVWQLEELANALTSPTTDRALGAALGKALSQVLFLSIYGPVAAANMTDGYVVVTREGSIGTHQQGELQLKKSLASPVFTPYYQRAANQLTAAGGSGTVDIKVPALQLSYLNLQELDNLINTTTDNLLRTYFGTARTQLQTAIRNLLTLQTNQLVSRIVVAVPVPSFESVMAPYFDARAAVFPLVLNKPPTPIFD